jgi:hypothetical protein
MNAGDRMKKGTISEVMSHLARLRAKKLAPAVRAKIASNAGKASWAGMTAEERSVELKRRAAKRRKGSDAIRRSAEKSSLLTK